MLDGRIDTQSPIQDLRAQGNTENITLEAADEVKKEELKEAVVPLAIWKFSMVLRSHTSKRRRNRAS
jgi:hypothetical protein